MNREEGHDRKTQSTDDILSPKRSGQLVNPRLPTKYTIYTPLVYSLEHIFHVDNWNKIPPARPLKSLGKNQDQFCHYHNSPGHWTSTCYVLRDVVEQLVREGKLQQFVDQTKERKTHDQAMQNVPNRAAAAAPTGTQPRQHQTNHGGCDEDDMEFPVVYAIFGGRKARIYSL